MTKTNKDIQEKSTGLGWNNKHGRGGGGITEFIGGGPGWMGVLGVLGPWHNGKEQGIRAGLDEDTLGQDRGNSPGKRHDIGDRRNKRMT